jgi:hypothetical protein
MTRANQHQGEDMNTRKCKVFVDGSPQEATFHQFGTEIVHGSDNEPQQKTVAIVELADGKVKHFQPDKIKFLDKAE